jgi:hypothetical protein
MDKNHMLMLVAQAIETMERGVMQMLTFDVLSQKLQTQDHWHTVPKSSFSLEFPKTEKEKRSPIV